MTELPVQEKGPVEYSTYVSPSGNRKFIVGPHSVELWAYTGKTRVQKTELGEKEVEEWFLLLGAQDVEEAPAAVFTGTKGKLKKLNGSTTQITFQSLPSKIDTSRTYENLLDQFKNQDFGDPKIILNNNKSFTVYDPTALSEPTQD